MRYDLLPFISHEAAVLDPVTKTNAEYKVKLAKNLPSVYAF